MIRTGGKPVIAPYIRNNAGATVGTPVYIPMNLAVIAPGKNDWRGADIGRDKISGLFDFAFKPQKVPARSTEEFFLLLLKDIFIYIDKIGDMTIIYAPFHFSRT